MTGVPASRRSYSLATVLLLVALLTAAAACARAASPAASPSSASFPVTLTDDDGARVTIDAPPRRIVTFAPSITEIVYALGLGSRVVGVSGSFDNYPPAAARLPHVSDPNFQPDAEKVVGLRPQLFLMGFSGYQQADQHLRQLGVPVFASTSNDLDDLFHDIGTIGRLTGTSSRAQALVASMRRQAASIQAGASSQPAVSCFLDNGLFSGAVSTVGPGSFIYDLLTRAGCAPVTSHAKNAYPQWSVEQLVKDDPAVYLVSTEAGLTIAGVERRPGYSALSAVRQGRVFVVDADLISRPGPRAVQGLALLARDLHTRTVP